MQPTDTTLALSHAEFQFEPLAERFFSQCNPELDDSASLAGDAADATDARRGGLSRTERRAMRATFVMLALFAVALGAFLIYSRIVMPVPAALSGERGVEMVGATPSPLLP